MTDDAQFAAARAYFLQGVSHQEARRFAEAEAAYRASLALLPGRPSTLTNLGATLVELQRPAEALPLLDQALAAAPDEPEALGHRATALNMLGRPADALPDLQRFVARHPARTAGWFHLGQTLQLLGRHADALAAYDRTIEQMPEHAQAHSNRGGALKDLGRPDEAARAFEQAIALGADAELNRYYLASVRAATTGPTAAAPATAPRVFIERLFDHYADGFDEHLVQTLQYRSPTRLAELVAGLGHRRFRSALDLGCGTGLCGPLVAPLADRLEGVDLSSQMLAVAAGRGHYAELVHADVAEHLQTTPRRHDLVIAADVFVYIGDLTPVFAGAARVLDAPGVFAFTVERAGDDGPGFVLRPSMRYAHAERYVRDLAAAHGFAVRHLEAGTLRQDQQRDVAGLYFVLERAS